MFKYMKQLFQSEFIQQHFFSKKNNAGFTLVELLVVITIISLLTVATISIFVRFRNNQAFSKDREMIVSVLRDARNQTLTSKDSSQYGVHVSASKITFFVGSVYSSGASSNKNFPLMSADTVLTANLTGGGSDIIFNRLSGETNQDGTVSMFSSSLAKTKIITIYKTGLIESQ